MRTYSFMIVISFLISGISCKNENEKINFNDAVELMLDHSFNIEPLILPPPPPPPGYVDSSSYKNVSITPNRNLCLLLSDRFSKELYENVKDSLFSFSLNFSNIVHNYEIKSGIRIDTFRNHKVLCIPEDTLINNTIQLRDFQYKKSAFGTIFFSQPFFYEKKGSKFFVFWLSYICGHLCHRELAYILEYKDNKFKIIGFRPLFQYDVS